MGKINIIIVDDNSAFLETMEYQLQRHGKFNIIGRFTSGAELLEFPDLIRCKILLMDIELPGINGIAVARVVNFIYNHIKMIAVTMYKDQVYLEQLIKAGFRGFVSKFEVAEKLIPVICEVMTNKLSFPTDLKI